MRFSDLPVGSKFDNEISYCGYYVYAIFDEADKCAYVGVSRNVKRRLVIHRTGNSHVEDLSLVFEKPHNIVLFTIGDVDALYEIRNGCVPEFLPKTTAKGMAEDAEWYMCQVLKPYMNRRKTYAKTIEGAMFFFRRGIMDKCMVMHHASEALKDFGVLPDRYEEEMARVENTLNAY